MQAVGIADYGDVDMLTQLTLPVPQPGPGQLLVRVQSAGVNPVDLLMRQGAMRTVMPLPMPAVLGLDLAGIVVAKGEGAGGPAIGEPVFGRALLGSMAEFALTTPESIAPRPSALTAEQAASLPTAGIAAWHALHSYAALAQAETVLVLGGASMVGQFAIQLAKATGAKVFATASAQNLAHVRSLGADQVIDYTNEDLASAMTTVDVVIDCVSGPTAAQALSLAHSGARFVSLGQPPDEALAQARGVKLDRVFKMNRSGDSAILARLADDLVAGRLKTEIAWTCELQAQDLREAHRRLATRHQRGKTIVHVSR